MGGVNLVGASNHEALDCRGAVRGGAGAPHIFLENGKKAADFTEKL